MPLPLAQWGREGGWSAPSKQAKQLSSFTDGVSTRCKGPDNREPQPVTPKSIRGTHQSAQWAEPHIIVLAVEYTFDKHFPNVHILLTPGWCS